MVKVACILIPHLPVQFERQQEPSLLEHPLVVGGRPWDPGVVLDCCENAMTSGVHPGMSLSRAETLCPAAQFVLAHEQAYQAVHSALVSAVGHFTPLVETAQLGFLYAEVSGLRRTFGPDVDLAHQIALKTSSQSSLTATVGIASTKFSAHQAALAAQLGESLVVPAKEERLFLSSLPITTLPADPEIERRLEMLGIVTLGELAKLPQLALVRQFGPHAGTLHDLARGVDPRPVHPDAPPLTIVRRRTFDEPLMARPPLQAHIWQMASELSTALAKGSNQAEGLRLKLVEELGETHSHSLAVKPPSASTVRLTGLAGQLFERLEPAGPITELELTIYPLRPDYLGATQLTLLGQDQENRRHRLRKVLRNIRHRFGELAIVMAALAGPPPPVRIQVTTDHDLVPRALIWRERIYPVTTVYESWRERKHWWSKPIEQDYHRLETKGGYVQVVYREVRADRWWLVRKSI